MHKYGRLVLVSLFSLLGYTSAQAEVVVVVGAKAEIASLSKEEVINIFLGRYRRLGHIAAVPVDLAAGDDLRAEFYRKLVDKDVSEINAYWARLLFSGKTTPPMQAATPAEVVTIVSKTPGGIGYIDRRQLDARVKAVLSLGP